MKLNNKTIRQAVEEWLNDEKKAESKYGHISNWDVSSVTDMGDIFRFDSDFNQDLSYWDVSNVTNMFMMFYEASNFNQSIGNWDVSNVTNMGCMFCGAKSFNQPIGDWDMSSVTTTQSMFNGAKSFNQPIGEWNVSNVDYFRNMFKDASSFNQDIAGWDVVFSKELMEDDGMYHMFNGAKLFNHELSKWLIPNDMWNEIFYNATLFNINFNKNQRERIPIVPFKNTINNKILKQAADEWYLDNPSAQIRYGDISKWNVSKVTNMSKLFFEFSHFNEDISKWDTSNVRNFSRMFQEAETFNQSIEEWDTSSATNMKGMFSGAKSFNQPIGEWNVSQVTDMKDMFFNAESFSQDLSKWKKKSSVDCRKMFTEAKMFAKNYDIHSLTKKIGTIDKESKKIISNITKLIKTRDYKLIDSAIEILKSEHNNALYEYFLNGIRLDSDGKFIYSKLFKGSRITQPYLDYALLLMINSAPKKLEINNSINADNIHIISLSAQFYNSLFVFRIDEYIDQEDCGKFTTEKFPNFNFNNLKNISLTNYVNIKSLDFLKGCKKLKNIYLKTCKKVSKNEVIKSLPFVDNIKIID